MAIPKTHTLTLTKRTITAGTTGSQIKTEGTVQTIAGSLQQIRQGQEIEFNKQTVKANWVFYFDSALLLTANKAEMKESAIMTYTDPMSATVTLQVVGVDDSKASGPHYQFYKILLLEVK